ncbi:MAG: PilZ domain-containing protein [Myxococcaceae bacterium]
MSELRRHPRIPVTLLVEHQAGPAEPRHVDYAVNISRSGIFIRTDAPAPEGTGVALSFAPKRDARLVHAYARVARTTKDGMAAEFLQMDPESAQLLETALN